MTISIKGVPLTENIKSLETPMGLVMGRMVSYANSAPGCARQPMSKSMYMPPYVYRTK